ncbi:MAG: hypothetical protein BM556_11520 [Bacteriovorax sp. MedPE-SWde]|nr:MAG: hypothetical protein BM556_11520 [Bacteriovorax sp. MedPE-SWde]
MKKVTILLIASLCALSANANRRCVNYVSGIYQEMYSSSYAREKARKDCRGASAATIRFAFPKYEESFSTKYAIEKAIKLSKKVDMRGYKRQMEFTFNIYDEKYSTSYALEKTIKLADDLSYTSYGCLRGEYDYLRDSYSSIYSLEKAIKNCWD